jgi:HAD superfamily hydrolase (TIGR01549 family)
MADGGLRLGIFSDFRPATKLRALRIEHFFEVVISAQDLEVQRFKPDPLGLELVLERMGIVATQALYVGDRAEIDGAAAHRAGMAFFAAGDGDPEQVTSFQRLREMVLGLKA